MQQQNNHIKPLVDPELIRRYLAGELDSKAMHALERQALDDPFLADALEGFELHEADQEVNLADLQHRLEQRVIEKRKRVIPMFIRLAAAAAVILIGGASIIWFWRTTPGRPEMAKLSPILDTVVPVPVQVPAPATYSAVPDKKQDNYKFKQPEPDSAQVEMESSLPVPSIAPAPVAKVAKEEADRDEVTVASNDISEDKDSRLMSSKGKIVAQPLAANRMATYRVTDSHTLSGRVTNTRGDSGLAGVAISIGAYGTQTDSDGKFNVPVSNYTFGNQTLMAYASGYQSWAGKIKGNEDDLKISLRKFDDTIYLSPQDLYQSDSAYEPPHPQIGYDKYEEYLAQHIQYPLSVKMTGRVRVSFIVQSNGALTDFKVVRKLHPDYDQEAIRVIRTGPVWVPSTDGRPTRARVDVRFK